MSSDEAISTQLSTFSNAGRKKDKLKHHKSEPWGINLIGNFLLNLYHRSLFGHHNEWSIKESEIRKEYSTYITEDLSKKLYEMNSTADIGTLLYRFGFLINTPRGSSFFKIRYFSLFEFRNNIFQKLDYLQKNADGYVNIDQNSQNLLLNLNENKSNIFVEDYEFDENEEIKFLEYQGTIRQRRLEDYHPTNMSCCICQESFTTIETYEEHIQKHGEDTDFEFLTTMDKQSTPIFKINYRLCKNSHYFCFEIETDMDDLIIEKIIIVQSRSFYYVHNMQVPYKCPETGKDRFFVDSHLFTIHVEQPIVLIFHRENINEIRIIEHHNFMRSEEFPKVNFSINSNRLPNQKLFKSKIHLPEYFPPKNIQEALKDDFAYEKLMKTCNEFRDYIRNGKNLQPHNIGKSLNILLQVEDMDTILKYVGLTQKNVTLRSYGDEYSFRLKTKQRIYIENIIAPYDEVVLTSNTDIFSKNEEIMKLMLLSKSDIKYIMDTYVGIIEAVNTSRISFRCDQKINMKSEYTIICRPSRLNLRHQYRSLQLLPDNMYFLEKFLFPSKIIPRPLSNMNLKLYNSNINDEQLQAVRNIAEGPRNDATYIIFGPPGTGKTLTIVEGILQVLKRPNTKILVTASSNSACDEIAIRLCKYVKDLDMVRAMVRIYSRSSEIRSETIDDELLENSNMYNGHFYPDIAILHEYRIVVCTLSVVAKLVTGKFGCQENGTSLYTHLFIDEIAATTEAEALIGITTILSPKSCLIISGDYKQLGAILQSKRAVELGLGVSLMERLLARDCYRVDGDTNDYDRSIQTRLTRNYRSHPAIVKLYNGLYYNHSLEACAKRDDVSLGEVWHRCRNKEFPIMFHAVYVPSQSDNQSHSLYNLGELNVVMDYVKDLMYFGINGKPVKESDIGIISPYKKQFKRIQEELNLRKWFDIETGSVETFQGKEKNIIIVSFVRSGISNLGFLENQRRLNVTISRPKSLLILIGNPKTLSLNSDFEYIIKECQRNNTLLGSSEPKKGEKGRQLAGNRIKSDNNLSDLNKNLQALNIAQNGQKQNIKNPINVNVPEKSIDKDRKQSRLPRSLNNKSNTRIDKNLINTKGENEDNENLSDDNDGNDQPSTTKISKNKTNSENLGRVRNNRNTKTFKCSGKICKKYGKDKQRRVADNNKPLDSIFDELPRVSTQLFKTKNLTIFDELPRVPTQLFTTKNLTIFDELPRVPTQLCLQQPNRFQQQPQRFNNLQQQQPQNYNNLQQDFNKRKQLEKQYENKSYTNRSNEFNKNMNTNPWNTNNTKDSKTTEGNKVSITENATIKSSRIADYTCKSSMNTENSQENKIIKSYRELQNIASPQQPISELPNKDKKSKNKKSIDKDRKQSRLPRSRNNKSNTRIDKNLINTKGENEDNENLSDDNDGNDQPSTTKISKNKTNSENLGRVRNNRNTKTFKCSGKICQKYGKDKQRRVADNNKPLESIFDELPRVSTQLFTTKNLTIFDELPRVPTQLCLQQPNRFQQQPQRFNNLQQQQPQNYNNLQQDFNKRKQLEKQYENKSYTNRSNEFNKNMNTNPWNTNNTKDSKTTEGNKVSITENATIKSSRIADYTWNTNNTKDSKTTEGNKVSITENATIKSSRIADYTCKSSMNTENSQENKIIKSYRELQNIASPQQPISELPNKDKKSKNSECCII
ncbi:uncharacterized protein ACRADG_011556 isoform 2-T3 [Cochliomyia hominivorax]